MTTLRTNQDLDHHRPREVFGIFPSGVVAVAAIVEGAPVRTRRRVQRPLAPGVHRSRFGRLQPG